VHGAAGAGSGAAATVGEWAGAFAGAHDGNGGGGDSGDEDSGRRDGTVCVSSVVQAEGGERENGVMVGGGQACAAGGMPVGVPLWLAWCACRVVFTVDHPWPARVVRAPPTCRAWYPLRRALALSLTRTT